MLQVKSFATKGSSQNRKKNIPGQTIWQPQKEHGIEFDNQAPAKKNFKGKGAGKGKNIFSEKKKKNAQACSPAFFREKIFLYATF